MEGLGLGVGSTGGPRVEKKTKENKTMSPHFLIVEGLALCSIIHQILLISMACSCVWENILPTALKWTTWVNQLNKCAMRQKKLFFWCLFMYFLVSVSPWLSHIQYVSLDYSLQQFFYNSSTSHICPLYSPLIVCLSRPK